MKRLRTMRAKETKLATMIFFGLICFWMSSIPAQALDVNITKDIPFIEIPYGGETIRIQRIQDTSHMLTNSYAKTSRVCPPFCIHPMKAAPGVETVGEVELLNFLDTKVRQNTGVLIDARLPSWFKKGTIPGSVNVPFKVFLAPIDNPGIQKILHALGVKKNANGTLDFKDARTLLLFCNGPWCDQSPRAIKGLLAYGYPPSKLLYYRGGMQLWQLFGLTTVAP